MNIYKLNIKPNDICDICKKDKAIKYFLNTAIKLCENPNCKKEAQFIWDSDSSWEET